MTAASSAVPIVDSVQDIGKGYRAWFVDIWGVMHNGRTAFPEASAATRAFRDQGGVVVLLSNSPRPSPAVQEQLREFGVPDEAYDATVTSGDLTRHELGKHAGAQVFHLGPGRDRAIFDGLDVALSAPEAAELIVCSGPFNDDVETPDDYTGLLGALAARRLLMICANPDHMVERGHRLVYCAGALAAVYETLGGKVIYAGKPHMPVYELALETAGRLAGETLDRERVLAIGDGLKTDIAGAGSFGIDSVFVASGLHAPGEGGEALDAAHLTELFGQEGRRPIAATRGLQW
ncbi:HAD family hydrolase [Methyloceanibacter marginalis]|uniref:HAD family hydrolase n=1 Tax=Methyloceanibacter marginalis TaxID=1774971 RepID=A0A1E3WDW2_9HYPH|nr:TIGR01459 family HAD-type hydrolase [Methyloceanibacter marginalis]ODS03993.1 HAD family hydrolase [Methyloceanibacter marginalis]